MVEWVKCGVGSIHQFPLSSALTALTTTTHLRTHDRVEGGGYYTGDYTRLMTDSFHVAWSDVSSVHNIHIPVLDHSPLL